MFVFLLTTPFLSPPHFLCPSSWHVLNENSYDHLILKLEWAKPSAPKDAGTEPTQVRSGYGQALAQDTKEKVSYASNLTSGAGGSGGASFVNTRF